MHEGDRGYADRAGERIGGLCRLLGRLRRVHLHRLLRTRGPAQVLEGIESILEQRANDVRHRDPPGIGDPLELLLEDRRNTGMEHPLFPSVLAALLIVPVAHTPLVTQRDTVATICVSQTCKHL